MNNNTINPNVNTAAVKDNDEVEIDLYKLIDAFRNRWFIIILVTLLCAAIGFAGTKFLMTPQYEASVQMIVNTTKVDSTTGVTQVSNDTNNLAKNLVDTYGVIIKSSSILSQLISDLQLDCTVEELEEMIDVAAVDDTQVFKITVTTDSSEKSASIVQELVNIAPDRIVSTVEAGSCKVVSNIDIVEDPVSPSYVKNIALAAIIGFIFVYAYAVFMEIRYSYIVTEEDVTEILGLPCIGAIPHFEDGKAK